MLPYQGILYLETKDVGTGFLRMTPYLHGVHETVALVKLDTLWRKEVSSTFDGEVFDHTLTEHSTEHQFQVMMTWWLQALKLLLCA